MGPLIPLFWTSGDVFPGFQSQSGSLACVLYRLCAMNLNLYLYEINFMNWKFSPLVVQPTPKHFRLLLIARYVKKLLVVPQKGD